jgi:hypothetical protein
VKLHTDMAGLLSIEFGPWCLHIFPKRRHWVWGHFEDWYDGPIPTWGTGPLFRLICFWPDAWCKTHHEYIQDCGCVARGTLDGNYEV